MNLKAYKALLLSYSSMSTTAGLSSFLPASEEEATLQPMAQHPWKSASLRPTSFLCHLFSLLTFPPACTKNTNLPSTLGTLELLSLLFSSSKNRFLSHLCILCAASLLLTSEAVCTHISSCKRQSGCVLFEMSSSTRPVSPPPPPHCLSCCPFIFPPCVGAHQGSIFYPPCAYTYSPSLTDSNDFYNLTADSQIQTSLLGSMFYTCVSAGHFYLDS